MLYRGACMEINRLVELLQEHRDIEAKGEADFKKTVEMLKSQHKKEMQEVRDFHAKAMKAAETHHEEIRKHVVDHAVAMARDEHSKELWEKSVENHKLKNEIVALQRTSDTQAKRITDLDEAWDHVMKMEELEATNRVRRAYEKANHIVPEFPGSPTPKIGGVMLSMPDPPAPIREVTIQEQHGEDVGRDLTPEEMKAFVASIEKPEQQS